MSIEITYDFSYMQDDMPVRGNAQVSGDAVDDKCVEDEIIADLNKGNDCAWALVEVTARIKAKDRLYIGRAHLGACCYNSEAEMKADLFDSDSYGLKAEAREDLLAKIRDEIAAGEHAAALLKEIES